MRRLENYVRKYGPEFGPIYFHTLQSQAAHAQVASRRCRKLDIPTGKLPALAKPEKPLPLFGAEEARHTDQADQVVANVA